MRGREGVGVYEGKARKEEYKREREGRKACEREREREKQQLGVDRGLHKITKYCVHLTTDSYSDIDLHLLMTSLSSYSKGTDLEGTCTSSETTRGLQCNIYLVSIYSIKMTIFSFDIQYQDDCI